MISDFDIISSSLGFIIRDLEVARPEILNI